MCNVYASLDQWDLFSMHPLEFIYVHDPTCTMYTCVQLYVHVHVHVQVCICTMCIGHNRSVQLYMHIHVHLQGTCVGE